MKKRTQDSGISSLETMEEAAASAVQALKGLI
jgi:hypothetical protein